MTPPSPLFAYFGPETMLPLTSVVATVVGVFLMFGRNTTRFVRRALRDRFARPAAPASRAIPRPHFSMPAEPRHAAESTRA
jgi:hypothetical protein